MLELFCLLIVAFWFLVRVPMETERLRLLAEAAAIMTMAWAAEQTCIILYGFYGYADSWWLMLGHVPLTVVLIWPVVVLSARDVIRAFMAATGAPDKAASPTRKALVMASAALVIVTLDAAFIEPAAVDADLWTWTEPGVFEVPVIGIVGWGLFGAMMVFALEMPSRITRALALVAALPALHATLLALWWGLFRYVTVPISDFAAGAAMVALGLAGAGWVLSRRESSKVPLPMVVLRTPGALFFVVLMALGAPPVWLVVWSVGISIPWSLLAVRAGLGGGQLRSQR